MSGFVSSPPMVVGDGSYQGEFDQGSQSTNEPTCATCSLIRMCTEREDEDEDVDADLTSKFFTLEEALAGDISDEDEGTPVSYQFKMEFFHGPHECEMEGIHTLCPLCNHWLEHLICRGRHLPHSTMVPMGTLDAIEARSECLGCQALHRFIMESRSAEERGDNAAEWREDLCTNNVEVSLRSRPFPDWAREDEVYDFRAEVALCTTGKGGGCFATFNVLPTVAAPCNVVQEMIDWDNLTDWLECLSITKVDASDASSSSSRLGEMTTPSQFALIDITRGCLTTVTDGDCPPYAALSYLWGRSENELATTTRNLEEIKRPGRLREEDVPCLLKDAMSVCARIGLKYLWVDRICIVQDDLATKMSQIEAMGHIYSKAMITLVSPDADNVHRGLAGVSRPRNPQFTISIGPMTMIPEYDTTKHALEDSAWSQRGWTYQEGYLARSLLVFGQDMLYLIHRANRFRPTVEFEGLQSRKKDSSPSFLCRSPRHGERPPNEFVELVTAYTSRQLTYESDILKAFLGVLSPFGPHCSGTPWTHFDFGMLWTHGNWNSGPREPTDEQNTPSWSWVHARGRVRFPNDFELRRSIDIDHNQIYSLATWGHVLNDDGSVDKITIQLIDRDPVPEEEDKKGEFDSREEDRIAYGPLIMALAADGFATFLYDLEERLYPIDSSQGSFGSEGYESMDYESTEGKSRDEDMMEYEPTESESIEYGPTEHESMNDESTRNESIGDESTDDESTVSSGTPQHIAMYMTPEIIAHPQFKHTALLKYLAIISWVVVAAHFKGKPMPLPLEEEFFHGPPQYKALTTGAKRAQREQVAILGTWKGFPSIGNLQECIAKLQLYKTLESSALKLNKRILSRRLLKFAKPLLTHDEVTAGLSAEEIAIASQSGRIIVRAPKLIVTLRHRLEAPDDITEWTDDKRGVDLYGCHVYAIEHNGFMLGTADLTHYHHQKLQSTRSHAQVTAGETIQASCLALSLGRSDLYDGRRYYINSGLKDYRTPLRMYVMIALPLSNGCSYRLGLGEVDILAWISCRAELEVTILE